MKYVTWTIVLLVCALGAMHYFGAQVEAAPHGDAQVPPDQAAVFSRETWLQDSPNHVILGYDLRQSSADLKLDAHAVQASMTSALCQSAEARGKNVAVVVNEPDGSSFLSFAANCQ